MNISPRTKLVGLIGHPVEHSLSPKLHNSLYEKYKLDYVYLAFDIVPDDVGKAVEALKILGFKGFNVTIPHKEKIIWFLDSLDTEAAIIGAVNTVKQEGGKLIGYNTDGMGFVDSIKRRGVELKDKSALVLGAGGSARAICVYLLKEGIRKLHIYNRTKEKALDLIEHLERFFPCTSLGYVAGEDINCVHPDLVINTTPVGMWPHIDVMPIENFEFLPHMTVVDIIYNPLETLFLKKARQTGCITINGLDMLVGQAIKAIEIWTGVKVDYDEAIRTLSEKDKSLL
ncbi:shikimate dehydrogenase [Caldicoprobacter guelmensis]|uniref:shikimate dehydrogenase n=1 Tax=Caldicoprobacter guelmensis TaxID=1170224 RepID=UPI00195821F4|nr:shikimate dehydrogenase [Caldicoprobacter guelmensis]MBM7581262.1 shikimate dehydrogenase [Caldicoprobacter guelmensis]